MGTQLAEALCGRTASFPLPAGLWGLKSPSPRWRHRAEPCVGLQGGDKGPHDGRQDGQVCRGTRSGAAGCDLLPCLGLLPRQPGRLWAGPRERLVPSGCLRSLSRSELSSWCCNYTRHKSAGEVSLSPLPFARKGKCSPRVLRRPSTVLPARRVRSTHCSPSEVATLCAPGTHLCPGARLAGGSLQLGHSFSPGPQTLLISGAGTEQHHHHQ